MNDWQLSSGDSDLSSNFTAPPLLRYVAEVIAVATYKLFGKILSFLIFTQIA